MERIQAAFWVFPVAAVLAGAAAWLLGWLNPAVLAALVLVAAVPLLVRLVRHFTLWEPPTCTLSALEVPLGGAIEVDYQRRSRRPVDVAGGQLVAEIICEEEIEFSTTDSDGDRVNRTRRQDAGGTAVRW